VDILGKVSGGVVVLKDPKALPDGTTVRVEALKDPDVDVEAPQGGQSVAEMLCSLSGICKDLPTDLARNHDHYLYGLPKK
jgi:hypothetical protein